MSVHIWCDVGSSWSPWCFAPPRPDDPYPVLKAAECLRCGCRNGEFPPIYTSDTHRTYKNTLRMKCRITLPWKFLVTLCLLLAFFPTQNYTKEGPAQQLRPGPFLGLCQTKHQKSCNFGLLFSTQRSSIRPLLQMIPTTKFHFWKAQFEPHLLRKPEISLPISVLSLGNMSIGEPYKQWIPQGQLALPQHWWFHRRCQGLSRIQ